MTPLKWITLLLIWFFSMIPIHLSDYIAVALVWLELTQNCSMFVLNLQKVDLVELVWLLEFGQRFGGGHGWSRNSVLLRSYDGFVTVECAAVFRSWIEFYLTLGAAFGSDWSWAGVIYWIIIIQARNLADQLGLICFWFSEELAIRINEHIRVDFSVVRFRPQAALACLNFCSHHHLLSIWPWFRIDYLLNDALRPGKIWLGMAENFSLLWAALSKFQNGLDIHRFYQQTTLFFLFWATCGPLTFSQLFLIFVLIFWFEQTLVNGVKFCHILV